jgi:hypothetical protein
VGVHCNFLNIGGKKKGYNFAGVNVFFPFFLCWFTSLLHCDSFY